MSGGFPAAWLARREPYDHAARATDLAGALDAALPAGRVTLVDYGCGLGSNFRWLSPRLDRPQHWTLVDHDPLLLEAVPKALTTWAADKGLSVVEADGCLRIGPAVEVRLVQCDLNDLATPWPDAEVVTTQALLDLVSDAWLARLAAKVVAGRPLLAALSVDGRVSFHPSDADDDAVMAAFRAHQLTDRGFGPSPGPRAAAMLAGRLAAAGVPCTLAEADWRIPGSDPTMATTMTDGIAAAAAEMEAVVSPKRVSRWADRRRGMATRGELGLSVGHVDLLALPRG